MPEESKRKHEEDIEPEDLTAGFLCNLIRRTTGQSVGEFITDMVQKENLTLEDLEPVMNKLPSFPKSDWEKVALSFDLDSSRDKYQLAPFSIPRAYLPPSFHKRVMKDSTQWLDVYQERGSPMKGTDQLRLMDAWHVPVCALFKGRIVDAPETPSLGTAEISGVNIGHGVYMLQGIILLVVELKLDIKNELDHIAQVLLQLAAAYKINYNKDYELQPCVYAILTDLQHFYFFSYNGSTFKMDPEVYVSSETRAHFFYGMAEVTERLFSTLLQGYISNLNIVIEMSKRHSASENNSAVSKKTTKLNLKRPDIRYSNDNWTKAVLKAQEAQTILIECDRSSMKVWEDAGQQGLLLLEESVSYLTKFGSLTDWDQQEMEIEIDKVLLKRCRPHNDVADDKFEALRKYFSKEY